MSRTTKGDRDLDDKSQHCGGSRDYNGLFLKRSQPKNCKYGGPTSLRRVGDMKHMAI